MLYDTLYDEMSRRGKFLETEVIQQLCRAEGDWGGVGKRQLVANEFVG